MPLFDRNILICFPHLELASWVTSNTLDSALGASTDILATSSDRHTTSRRPTHDITRHFGDTLRHFPSTSRI